MLLIVVIALILLTLALALARALLGPSLFDRILAVNMAGTKSVLLIALFAAWSGRMDLLDIALLYSLLNFLAVVAALRLIERGKHFAYLDKEEQ
ncbi:monovalent cation/H+ antiporter complex subunit F [Aliiglaciecola sp. CAU 1673]|uniref:monovalent cation/H+ antiporter complex subunit F n=1 Tax=Aliiglaciecola sp. CAU 1673 TaxID=3032595 RepID=UPI0023DC3437|nr:monovalent cation/H+ antiporter complex subunit F [Aliiglaciecola sp. CAU 1673]MDF2179840.1 monovalent cation/H+ antiporter complex subunit F [Aliiglaciecola sp. CAU 1673]